MLRSTPWQSYRQVATQTASPGQLVLMLYDGALRFLDRALAGFELEDPLEFNLAVSNNILRAQAVINELNVSLNHRDGAELSKTLQSLYLYFDRRLQESNIRKEKSGLQEVIQRLTVLRDAWAEMLQKPSDSLGAAEPAAATLA